MSGLPFDEVLRSYIDALQVDQGTAHVSGWVFHPTVQIDSVSISLNGAPLVEHTATFDRPDVQAAFPNYRCALRSGFRASAPLAGTLDPLRASIEIAPHAGGRALPTVRTGFMRGDDERRTRPQPPVHLQDRVGGSTRFVEVGLEIMTLVRTYIEKHKPMAEIERLLDWGCGCGRVMAQLQKYVPGEKLYGCDIDSEAIAWARQNLVGARFEAVGPYPPTPYEDGFFDAVYGISVMTHLDEETQFAWLRELARITRPGAVLLLSVIGSDLRTSNMPAPLASTYEKTGFAAMVPNYSDLLAPFSHKKYYKEAYHSRDYVARNWSRFFDLLGYVETRYQDLVMMRARA